MNITIKATSTGFLVVFLSMYFLLLIGCGPAVVVGTAAGAYATMSDERPVESQLSDSTITLKVTSRLFEDPEIRSVNLDIDTYQGVVHLNGVMLSKEQIAKVIQLTGSVNGVRMINNNLQLKQ
ncbi:MAG: BON domain-containing protein [Deltaproteobacteria bacterium]|nr:BON domain-containing protein [Deltaproteobacteria bacterium]